jgi:hypothetical protein
MNNEEDNHDRAIKALTVDEEEIARHTKGGTVDILKAVFESRPVDERIRQARKSAFQSGLVLANANRVGLEPSPDAQLTRPMSPSRVEEIVLRKNKGQGRGDRFLDAYVYSRIIPARQIKDRTWVFDLDKLQETFTGIFDPDQLR